MSVYIDTKSPPERQALIFARFRDDLCPTTYLTSSGCRLTCRQQGSVPHEPRGTPRDRSGKGRPPIPRILYISKAPTSALVLRTLPDKLSCHRSLEWLVNVISIERVVDVPSCLLRRRMTTWHRRPATSVYALLSRTTAACLN